MTREEAIDILKTMWQVSTKGGPIEEALEIAIQALHEPQWIPVSERLPQIGEKVFVADADGNMDMGRLGFDKKGNYIWSFQTCWNDFEDWIMWHPCPNRGRKVMRNDRT